MLSNRLFTYQILRYPLDMSSSERHAGIDSDIDRERADLHTHFQPYPTVTSSLCGVCQVIVSILGGERKYCLGQHAENRCEHDFQPSARAFFDSAQAGCPSCILVWEVFSIELDLPFSEYSTDPEFVGFKYWVNSRGGIFTDPSEPYWLTFFAHPSNDPIKSPMVQVHGSTVNGEHSRIFRVRSFIYFVQTGQRGLWEDWMLTERR